ncbi:MAG: nucleoside deaminase [Oscillospiraceae bacterium]|nr:nucleoside deaminase [Oscillospiraceae bacterium]
MTGKEYMDIAIELSKKAVYPFGAIIVKDNEIIGRSDSNTATAKCAFAHAELIAIEDAMEQLGGYLCAEGGEGVTIYASSEPCVMCMGAILYTGISRLVYASTIEDSKEVVNAILVKAEDIVNSCANRNLEIVHEFERESAVKVLNEWSEKNQ